MQESVPPYLLINSRVTLKRDRIWGRDAACDSAGAGTGTVTITGPETCCCCWLLVAGYCLRLLLLPVFGTPAELPRETTDLPSELPVEVFPRDASYDSTGLLHS